MQEPSAAVRLVIVVVVSPVPIIASVVWVPGVWVCIHYTRLGNHYRRLLHDHRCGLHDHGLWGDHDWRCGHNCDWKWQPKPNGNMHPSRVCRERQGKACDSEEGHNPKRS